MTEKFSHANTDRSDQAEPAHSGHLWNAVIIETYSPRSLNASNLQRSPLGDALDFGNMDQLYGTGSNLDGGKGSNLDGGKGSNLDGGKGSNLDGGSGSNLDGGNGLAGRISNRISDRSSDRSAESAEQPVAYSLAKKDAVMNELYQMFPGLQRSTFLGAVNEEANIAVGLFHRGDDLATKLKWAYDSFHNGGPYDYKNIFTKNSEGLAAPEWVQNLGNFNYGVMLAAAGFKLQEAQKAAGVAQIKAGTSRPEWKTPLTGYPYGDDPADQEQIKKGFEWYQKYEAATKTTANA